jgi:uncharacterized protein (DUF1778 family)
MVAGMPRAAPPPTVKRHRVSLDVSPDLRRRLRMAAARRDTTMSRYVLDAVQEQLRRDHGAQDLLALTARADPVLAELWDNRRDSEYDRL